MSRKERRALAFLFSLAVAGHLIRAVASSPGKAPGELVLLDKAGDGNPLAHQDSARALARPLGADERLDVDQATAEHLERLPGVGPALSRRIVADRESQGSFGSLNGLDRIPGIGPAMLARLAQHLTFSGQPADSSTVGGVSQIDINAATVAELESLPGIGPTRARAIVAFRDSAGPFREVDDLKRVRGFPLG